MSKITRPENKSNSSNTINLVISHSETLLILKENDLEKYVLRIERVYTKEICDKVRLEYLNAGWKDVTCETDDTGTYLILKR